MYKIRLKVRIGWLYPELMSTYGDRGNIIVLQKRCEWRGIDAQVSPIDLDTKVKQIQNVDLIFGGGAQDRQQEIVMRDLKGAKGETIKKMIEKDVPALFVCGSPQLMGRYYEPAVGKLIEGLGIFDMETKSPGPDAPRLIGNIVARINWENVSPSPIPSPLRERVRGEGHIVGFENHGGRTYLGKTAKPFAHVVKGFGNNGEDDTEGVVYKNAIGCYFHGPLLPKNPHVADFLIQKTLELKHKEKIELKPLDDALEWIAHKAIAKRLGIAL